MSFYLIELLTPHIPTNDRPKCLELFARYLLPDFTSIGLEVLKLQNLNLFDAKPTEMQS